MYCFSIFSTNKIISFSKSRPSILFVSKIFLKFPKFQPRCSCKTYSYKKKREYLSFAMSMIIFLSPILIHERRSSCDCHFFQPNLLNNLIHFFDVASSIIWLNLLFTITVRRNTYIL